jgi:hypothetical protein
MGIIYMNRPQFLIGDARDVKFKKLMFIKRGGKATHKLGDVSRDCLDAELICVSNEDKDNWIGNYAEGFGLFNVHFAKDDCRDASNEEVDKWTENQESIRF